MSAITAALVTSATPRWPEETFERVAVIAIVIGLAYTGFSEWLNVHVRHTWTYAPLMPILPIAGGLDLSPLLQWLVVPSLAIWTVRRDVDRNGSQSREPWHNL